jgi:hypothetical protein
MSGRTRASPQYKSAPIALSITTVDRIGYTALA